MMLSGVPLTGPRHSVGRIVAGEVVSSDDWLADDSEWITVLGVDAEAPQRSDVVGFQVQCEVCPQTALLVRQHASWVCPRCAEVAEPADGRAPWDPAWAKNPSLFDGDDRDRVSVQLADGTLWTGPAADADAIKRATAAIGSVLAFANTLLEDMSPAARRVNGFGDIDVAAAEPLPVTMQPPFPRSPMLMPLSDPLSAAIIGEVERNPSAPLVSAVVGGETFGLRGYIQRRNEPLEVEWVAESDLRLHVPQSVPVVDDEPDLGSIRG